jgi:hypothetical protein
MLYGMEARIDVVVEKAQHVVLTDKVQLARLHRFHRQFVGAASRHRVQAQHFASLRDSNN